MANEAEASATLDTMANPHPRMWRNAVVAYRAANAEDATDHDVSYWQGRWDTMLDATGYEPDRLMEILLTKLAVTPT